MSIRILIMWYFSANPNRDAQKYPTINIYIQYAMYACMCAMNTHAHTHHSFLQLFMCKLVVSVLLFMNLEENNNNKKNNNRKKIQKEKQPTNRRGQADGKENEIAYTHNQHKRPISEYSDV